MLGRKSRAEMFSSSRVLELVADLVKENDDIEVLWLYGSYAKNTNDIHSDLDLAVAFTPDFGGDAHGYPCDELAYQWSKKTDKKISVVNINRVPVPLASSIIQDGKILACKNYLRLHSEMQRIWSLWENFRYEHKKHRK